MLAQALIDTGLDGHVYSVELERVNYERAVQNIQSAGVASRVSLHCSDSIAFLESFVQTVDCIRFAFLDGSHLQDHVLKEFDIVHPKLADESIVFFDNTYRLNLENPEQRVNGALRMITQRYGSNLINFENTSWFTPGQAIWQRHGFGKDWR